MKIAYKKILILLVILSVIATLNCISAADDINASTDSVKAYVSPAGDDSLGDGSTNNPYKSIGYVIDHTSNDSEIYLDEGTYTGEGNRNITLDKSVTLIGKSKESTVIDCEHSSRLFTINSTSKLTLINLTLKNGNVTGNGGLINNEGGEITIKDCILSGSHASNNGGAVYISSGKLNIENTILSNNSAYQYGGRT